MKNEELTEFPVTKDIYSADSIALTKREYIATKAMQGILANYNCEPTQENHFKNVVEDAVKMADALINELNKP